MGDVQPNLDDNLSLKLERKGKVFEEPARFFAIAKIGGRFCCVRALLDTQGKVQELRQYHHRELEKEYAEDHMRRELWEQMGVRI